MDNTLLTILCWQCTHWTPTGDWRELGQSSARYEACVGVCALLGQVQEDDRTIANQHCQYAQAVRDDGTEFFRPVEKT